MIRVTDTNQPSGVPINNYYDYKEKALLFFDTSVQNALSLAVGNDLATKYVTEGMWELLLTTCTEAHADAIAVTEVMSDSFIANTFGANPIQLNLSGYAYMTPEEDHRADLFHMYHRAFRGSAQAANNIYLNFKIKNSLMRLYPLELQMTHSSSLEDMATFSMTAVASHYSTSSLVPIA